MNQMQLSKLSKDMIIEILLKTNQWEFYKIDIRNWSSYIGTFYVKCRSKDEVMKIMTESEDIKCAIMKFWKTFDDDVDILVNNDTNEIFFYSYHNSGTPNKNFSSVYKNFEFIVSPRFPELLKAWMETELEGIFIERIEMIS